MGNLWSKEKHYSKGWGNKYPRVLIIGDRTASRAFNASSGGFVSVMADRFIRRIDFIVRSNQQWSYNTLANDTLLKQIYNWNLDPCPMAVVLILGRVDMNTKQTSSRVSLDDYTTNLKHIITSLKAYGYVPNKAKAPFSLTLFC